MRRKTSNGKIRPRQREAGYMLLILLIMVAVLSIFLLQVAENYRQSIRRDREVEMIHRGVQYERAVQRYYRKFGTYPASLEALENTQKIRFLRKRYKDPMSADGNWQLVHLTDVKISSTGGITVSSHDDTLFGSTGTSNSEEATEGASDAAQPTASSSSSTTSSSTTSSNPTASGQTLGGGQILGVVSKSKLRGIHVFANKSKYNEWLFIYDPSQDRGQQISGPYNPKLVLGTVTSTTTKSGSSSTTGSTTTGSTNATSSGTNATGGSTTSDTSSGTTGDAAAQ